MAKQKKAVIDARIEKLKSLGYESVPNSQGNYHTGRELDRMTIQRKDIEYMPDEEWNVVMAKVEEDHSKHIPFTEAEVIEQPKELSVVDESMKKELKAFESNPLVVAIAEFKNKFAGLTFAGLEDKAAIEALKSAKKTVQKTRTFVTKHEETLKAPYLAHLNEIRAVSKKYQALIEPIEDPLDKELERLKGLEAAEEIRIKAEEEKEINRRIEVLKEAGMKFDGSFYCIAERSMDIGTVKAMTTEAFDDLVEKVKGDKKRLDDLEEQRLADLKKERLTARGNMLLTLGMVVDAAGTYTSEHLEGVKVLEACLTDEPDDKFMILISSLGKRINDAKVRAKDEADKKAKERTVSLRSKLLLAIGMDRVNWIPGTTKPGFYFKNAFGEFSVDVPMLELMDDDAFDKLNESFETSIKDAKDKAVKKEEEDKAAEKLSQDRSQQLIALGMTRAPRESCFIFNLPDATTQFSVAYGELTGKSPEAWEAVIAEVTELIQTIKNQQQAIEDKRTKDKKDKEEKDAKDAMTFQERQYQLVNLGMAIVAGSFLVKNEFGDTATISVDEVKALDEDVWPRRLMEVTAAVEEVKRLTAQKRQKAIDDAEALKPEITKVKEYIASFTGLPMPEFKDEKLMEICNELDFAINTALKAALNKVDLLNK